MLRDDLQAVLDTSVNFATAGGPAMASRDRALARAKGRIEAHVALAGGSVGSHLSVQVGGRQANYSPTAWLRVFAPDKSPRATEGYYLCYLFAADGSGVYLSLNQGTSEFRSNHMRPIRDPRALRARGSEARQLVSEWFQAPAFSSAMLEVDLRGATVTAVGQESRLRISNYEHANIMALHYASGSLPDDAHLLQDLTDMLSPLASLYGQSAAVPRADSDPATTPAPTVPRPVRQGRQLDAIARRAIELHAEDQAESWLRGHGWEVERVGGLHLGFDLLCSRGGEALHVEVKGTVTRGEEVTLTPNEVRHATDGGCQAEHALAVSSNIVLNDDPVRPQCTGGQLLVITPWVPAQNALTPTEYSYLVPRPSRLRELA